MTMGRKKYPGLRLRRKKTQGKDDEVMITNNTPNATTDRVSEPTRVYRTASRTTLIDDNTIPLSSKITKSDFVKAGGDWFVPGWLGFSQNTPLSPSIEASSDISFGDTELDVADLDDVTDEGKNFSYKESLND